MDTQLEPPFEGRKLYEVTITESIFVLAADDDEAGDIARRQANSGGDIDWNDADYDIGEAAYVPTAWADSIPFGFRRGEKYRTCGDVFTAWQEYEQHKPATQQELERVGQQRLV